MVQGEKGKRGNLDENTNQRKATRHNFQSVLTACHETVTQKFQIENGLSVYGGRA